MRTTKEEKKMCKEKYASSSAQNWHDPVSESDELVMKSNQKELDGQCFSPEERKLSDESDLKEWKQWIKNGCVRILFEWQITTTSILGPTDSEHGTD